MRVFQCPAKYHRFIESAVALALADVKRDMDRRADDHPGVRALATVHDQYLDHDAAGTLTILVGVADTDEAASAITRELAGATNR